MKPLYWRLGGLAAALLVLVAAWFLFINPQRELASNLAMQTADQQAASDQLRARISLLRKQSEELPQKEAELAAIGQRLPATTAIPSLIRTLTKVARDADVTMSSLTPGQATAIEVAAPAAAPSPSASATATAEASAAPAARQAPAAAVMAVPVGITACGSYAQLRDFVGDLESMQRAMLITGLNISRGDCANSGREDVLTATITASVFTLPVVSATPAPSPSGSAR